VRENKKQNAVGVGGLGAPYIPEGISTKPDTTASLFTIFTFHLPTLYKQTNSAKM
jgi:hypothetical protein